MKMRGGYVFLFWRGAWVLEAYAPTGKEERLGTCVVQGVQCNQFWCRDGMRAEPVGWVSCS